MAEGRGQPSGEEKPQRLYFKTYLQMIRGSVGTKMFQHFYVHTPEKGEFDAAEGGATAYAFYVSSVLVIFQKLDGIHGTVGRTVEELAKNGWQEVPENDLQVGDVVVWEPQSFPEGSYKHIGFAVGDGRAISTSLSKQEVVQHDLHFDEENRAIEQIFRIPSWD